MKNVLSSGGEREFFGNVGKGIGMAFGVKFFLIDFILWLVGVFVAVGSVGVRLYLRKKQGTAVLGFAWITLLFHLGLVFLIFLFSTNVMKTDSLSYERIMRYLLSTKFILFYSIGLGVAVIFHLFRDFETARVGMEREPFYSGKGIFSFFAKGSYRKELYTNLLDPILALIVGCWFCMQKGGEGLGWIIIFGAVCLFIEGLSHLAVDWRWRQSRITAEVMGEEYSKNTSPKPKPGERSEGKRPKIT